MTPRPLVLPVTALVALSLAAACAGPRAPFDVSTQSAPLALTLGEHAAVVAAPVGPISAPIPPALAPFLPVPQAPAEPVPDAPQPTVSAPAAVVPDLGPCPAFNAIAPVLSDSRELAGPPKAATYTYRASTTDRNGTLSQSYRGDSTWKVTVAPVSGVDGGYDVTTAVTTAKTVTTRVFRVLTKPLTAAQADPSQLDLNAQVIDVYNGLAASEGLPVLPRSAPNIGTYGPAGIYLVSQQTGSSRFTPTVPIPLVQTPLGSNTFTGVGSDGTTNMSFTSTVARNRVLNACGTKVDSTEVTLTNGTIASLAGGALSTVTFTETLDFGLLYGGLPLHDQGTVTSGPVGTSISRTFDYTVNSVPERAS